MDSLAILGVILLLVAAIIVTSRPRQRGAIKTSRREVLLYQKDRRLIMDAKRRGRGV